MRFFNTLEYVDRPDSAMTRQDALAIVQELEKQYLDAPHPGDSPASIKFFQHKADQLKWGVSFDLELSSMLDRAGIFYSHRKWQQYRNAGTLLHQSIARVRMRVDMAPDSSFH